MIMRQLTEVWSRFSHFFSEEGIITRFVRAGGPRICLSQLAALVRCTVKWVRLGDFFRYVSMFSALFGSTPDTVQTSVASRWTSDHELTWLSLSFFWEGACTQVQAGSPRHQGGGRVAQTPGTCCEVCGCPELAASHSAWTDTCALLNCLKHHHQHNHHHNDHHNQNRLPGFRLGCSVSRQCSSAKCSVTSAQELVAKADSGWFQRCFGFPVVPRRRGSDWVRVQT